MSLTIRLDNVQERRTRHLLSQYCTKIHFQTIAFTYNLNDVYPEALLGRCMVDLTITSSTCCTGHNKHVNFFVKFINVGFTISFRSEPGHRDNLNKTTLSSAASRSVCRQLSEFPFASSRRDPRPTDEKNECSHIFLPCSKGYCTDMGSPTSAKSRAWRVANPKVCLTVTDSSLVHPFRTHTE